MEAINRVGQFTINLIDDTNIKVKKARANHLNTDFTKDLILVDTLGNAQKIGTSDDYDGDNEVMNYGDYYKQTFTFDFYGNNAYTLASNFVAKLRSQSSYDLQTLNGLTVYRASTLENLRQLIGTVYRDRYQLEVIIGYWDEFGIDTLPIETLNGGLTLVEQ